MVKFTNEFKNKDLGPRGTITVGPVHSFSRPLNHALARNGGCKQYWMIIDACGQHLHDDVITVLIC